MPDSQPFLKHVAAALVAAPHAVTDSLAGDSVLADPSIAFTAAAPFSEPWQGGR